MLCDTNSAGKRLCSGTGSAPAADRSICMHYDHDTEGIVLKKSAVDSIYICCRLHTRDMRKIQISSLGKGNELREDKL